MNDAEAPVLCARGVTRGWNQGEERIEVLRELDLTVYPGERVAVTGVSGAGKSTLLHLLAGLDRPEAGRIEVAGRSIVDLGDPQLAAMRNRDLGFVYQFHHLLPEFSAVENVAMPLWIGGAGPSALERAQEMLELVGLANRAGHRPGQLSGGERQRVAVARALVHEPRVVLADEPTGNLDARNADRVQQLMVDLGARLHTAFVVVTHDARLAARMDRTLHLDRGQLRAAEGA